MALYQKYPDRPDLALKELFETDGLKSYGSKRKNLFLWQGGKSKEGVSYGSFKVVYEDELADRKYRVFWADYRPGIEFSDVVFDPKTNKYEQI